jgi:hypothetical protein
VHVRSMVQPARIREEQRAYDKTPLQDFALNQSKTKSRIPPVSERMQTRGRSYGNPPTTHIAVRDSVSRSQAGSFPQRAPSPSRYGDTVELAPRGAQQHTKTHGNIVQLPSRR